MVADLTGVRVVLADDHPIFRQGLRLVLEASGAVVTGEANGGDEVLALAADADVILMDLQMPRVHGVEATRRVVAAYPSLAVIVVSMSDQPVTLHAAVRAGARGFLVKGAHPDEIVGAIQAVLAGQAVFGGAASGAALAALAGTTPKGTLSGLTDRERDVAELMARGLNNATIAAQLHLAPGTVRNYASSCMDKLGATTRAEAVAIIRDAGT